MGNTFYINISIQTPDGPLRFGRYEVGSDGESARQLFNRFKGSAEVHARDMLYVELMEIVDDLPASLEVITCDLQELATNTMLVTQEVFRQANIRPPQ